MKRTKTTLASCALAAVLSSNANAQNLLQNGSFEDGTNFQTPNGWTSSGPDGVLPGGQPVPAGFMWDVAFAKDGSFVSSVQAPQGSFASSILYQDVSATAGATYDLSFYIGMHNPFVDTGTVFVEYLDNLGASIDGTKMVYVATSDDFLERSSPDVTEFSDLKLLSLGAAPSNAASIRVGITYQDNGTTFLDLTKTDAMDLTMTSVPEPSALVLSALAGCGFFLRRRR